MSGIVAIMSLDGRPVPPELPRAQLAAIAHRGEWEPRLWEAPGIALGHVNLPRTPEAEREFLPAPDSTGRYWLTWDGRLDNRDELAGKLGYDAAQRTDKTDADYVLDAFVKWGDDCVHHLLGDWAVVIWDSQARRLFCAKDPIGWRQLYYAEHDGLLAVGSEPQQFFANGWLPPLANFDHVVAYVADVERSPAETCLRDVWTLVGGHVLAVTQRPPTAVPFWTCPAQQPHRRDTRAVVEEFEGLFADALKVRLRSNRPVGVYLSGGLDSSYVAAVAAKLGVRSAVSAFAPETQRFDERHHIRLVADHCGLDVRLVDISECWALSSRWITGAMLQEDRTPPQGAMYVKLGKAAAEAGFGVMLGGEGADEWVDGHPTAAGAWLAGKPGLAAQVAWQSGATRPGQKARLLLREIVEEGLPSPIARGVRRVRSRATSARDRSYVATDRALQPTEYASPIPVWRRRDRQRQTWHAYRLQTQDAVGWRDRCALTPVGIDLRTPFNDLRLVELMAGLTETTKQFDGRSKAILRAAEARVLPAAIANRADFGVMGELIVRPLLERERERFDLGTESATRIPGLRAEAVTARANGWLDAPSNRDRDLTWRLITSGLWLRELQWVNRRRSELSPRSSATPSAERRWDIEEGIRTAISDSSRRHPRTDAGRLAGR